LNKYEISDFKYLTKTYLLASKFQAKSKFQIIGQKKKILVNWGGGGYTATQHQNSTAMFGLPSRTGQPPTSSANVPPHSNAPPSFLQNLRQGVSVSTPQMYEQPRTLFQPHDLPICMFEIFFSFTFLVKFFSDIFLCSKYAWISC
jgi:hypothetical protein